MLTLFSNGFSPFARKVAMALEYKGLGYETVDGDVTVVNSSDIVAYLDLAYPDRPIYPADLKARVEARALERLADTRADAILLDCSIWTWAAREDPPLPGLKEAGQHDLDAIFARIEATLAGLATPLPFGHPTIAEFAFWPHLAALRPLGFSLDVGKLPRLAAWFGAMRREQVFLDDARRTAEFMKAIGTRTDLERSKLFWRGDRIEWLLARGFHNWFFEEIKAGRTLWPE